MGFSYLDYNSGVLSTALSRKKTWLADPPHWPKEDITSIDTYRNTRKFGENRLSRSAV